jgi:uncharacterized membrane protein YphA (DoxX/SURF4 family)
MADHDPYADTLVVLILLALLSGLSFAVYGYQTLFGTPPRGEFDRYGMPPLRRFVGSMQLLGALGVLLGLGYAPVGALAAGGLSIMMALALTARVRIHDTPRLMVPAGSFGVVNVLLVVLFLAV